MLYGLKKDKDLFVIVISLLSHGCPVSAAAVTFLLDVGTVRAWLEKAGQHCQSVHQHHIDQQQLDLGQIQWDGS